MDEARFWSMIEAAWQVCGGKIKARQKLAEGKLSEAQAESLVELLDEVIQELSGALDKLPAEELLAFDRILERKMYDIDRKEIHAATDGSDDGFLYARGFIVAVGQGYYDAVNANPSIALMDLYCEEMCYLSWHLYQEKVGEVPPSEFWRESVSNPDGWPEFFPAAR